jgi:hypothetical protein
MAEHFENYSETDWANDFLIKAREGFSKEDLDKLPPLPELRGMLDKYNIRENEAEGFLEAYKSGGETLEQFLDNRTKNEQEKVVPLPEERKESEREHHQTAA